MNKTFIYIYIYLYKVLTVTSLWSMVTWVKKKKDETWMCEVCRDYHNYFKTQVVMVLRHANNRESYLSPWYQGTPDSDSITARVTCEFDVIPIYCCNLKMPFLSVHSSFQASQVKNIPCYIFCYWGFEFHIQFAGGWNWSPIKVAPNKRILSTLNFQGDKNVWYWMHK